MRLIDADNLEKSKFHPISYTHIVPQDTDAESYKRGWNDAVDAIVEDEPTASADPEWIPCSERLPHVEDGTSGVVLATCGSKNVKDTSIRWVRRLWFDGEYWNNVEGERYNQIVYAWMPQPKPYKGSENELRRTSD